MPQSVNGVFDGLWAALVTMYGTTTDPELGTQNAMWEDHPLVLVEGAPSVTVPDIIISMGTDARGSITRPTLGTPRSRETVLEIDVVISVAIGGDERVQGPARALAYELLEPLLEWFRVHGQETLGGACRDSFVTATPGQPYPATTAEGSIYGRAYDITATVTAYVRT